MKNEYRPFLSTSEIWEKRSKRIETSCEKQNWIYPEFYIFIFLSLKKQKPKKISKISSQISKITILEIIWLSKNYDKTSKRILKDITPMEVEEGEIKCPKCHGKKVLRTQAQTRSADEGTTAYFRCVNPLKISCKYKWRVN